MAEQGRVQPERVRVQMDFSEDAYQELMALKERTRATSPAEVIRDALGVLRWAQEHLAHGDKIMTQRGDGHTVTASFPFLEKG